MRKSIIAAVDENWLVGADGKMPWNLPADMRMFRELTMGKPIIMGRKTFDSLGKPLKGRTNIVLSNQLSLQHPGAVFVNSLEAAYEVAESSGAAECMVIGGANVYGQAMWHADRMYLSYIHHSFRNLRQRDRVYFPRQDWWRSRDWSEIERREFSKGGDSPYRWTFCAIDLKARIAAPRTSSLPPASPSVFLNA